MPRSRPPPEAGRPLPAGYAPRPRVGVWVAVTAAYLAVSGLGLVVAGAFRADGLALWYPPAGLDLALLLVFGPWYLPAVAVAHVLAVQVAGGDFGAGVLGLYVGLHTLLFGAAALTFQHVLGCNARLRSPRDALAFVGGAGILLPLAGAVLKASLLGVVGISGPERTWAEGVVTFAIGDATGIAMVTPLVLLALRPIHSIWWDRDRYPPVPARRLKPRRRVELVAVCAVTFALARLVLPFQGPPTFGLLIAFPVVWAALRRGALGAACSILALDVHVLLSGSGASLGAADVFAQEAQLTLVTVSLVAILIGAFVDGERSVRSVLRQAEERFEGAFQATPLLAFIAETRSAEIVDANHAFLQATGYGREEVVGRTSLALDLWEDPAERQRVVAGNAPGEPVRGAEVRWQDRAGRPLRVLLFRALYRRDDEQLALTMAQDITEQRLLEQSLLHAADREQRRLGRDLHDDLGQMLVGISYLAASLERSLREGEPGRAAAAARIHTLLAAALERARWIAHGLNPILEGDRGLREVLATYVEDLSRQFGLECSFHGPDDGADIRDPEAIVQVVRIVQEAVSNAVRHGRARRIEVELGRTPERGWVLRVRDHGRGLPESGVEGLGTKNMLWRARTLGGDLRVEPAAPEGTQVVLTFPERPPTGGPGPDAPDLR
ncbi:MAG: MASE1 domain-containing protein [Gemmatimonadetes bacterium]|nr:MASE1 domain-containing protein [Gemmatimonadota bacterium]